ncbi:hypothetical protein [Antribacter gilvus]|uniref:hypothetical protein n=1 Tax=Antribacter gilvus TaxID=2304675 RepID=UPI000F79423C|nr:hypothetical protein [Antribacter gilvus]
MRTHLYRDGGSVVVADVDATAADGSELVEAARFTPPGSDLGRFSFAAFPDLSRLVCASPDSVVCVDASGVVVWEHDLGVRRTEGLARTSVAVPADGTVVWVYAADALAGRGESDRWLVLAPATGDLLAQKALDCEGHDADHLHHPDGGLLLSVGMGQDGTAVFHGRYDDGTLSVTDLSADGVWDTIPCAISPDGNLMVSTAQSCQDNGKVHRFPDGDVIATLTLETLYPGGDPEELVVEYGCAGFLDQQTLIVTVVDENWDEENPGAPSEIRRVLVDLTTGERIGHLPPDQAGNDPDDFRPLGDGTWLAACDGRTRRHRSSAFFNLSV